MTRWDPFKTYGIFGGSVSFNGSYRHCDALGLVSFADHMLLYRFHMSGPLGSSSVEVSYPKVFDLN